MKRINFLIITIFLSFIFNFAKAEFNIPLKEFLKDKDIEKGSIQIYLLNRCSAIYTFASAILIKTDTANSKMFIEIANNLLFKSVELMVIDEEKKLENAQKKARTIRKKMFDIYVIDGKKNWEKNKSHFKDSYISDDMSICSKLVEDS